MQEPKKDVAGLEEPVRDNASLSEPLTLAEGDKFPLESGENATDVVLEKIGTECRNNSSPIQNRQVEADTEMARVEPPLQDVDTTTPENALVTDSTCSQEGTTEEVQPAETPVDDQNNDSQLKETQVKEPSEEARLTEIECSDPVPPLQEADSRGESENTSATDNEASQEGTTEEEVCVAESPLAPELQSAEPLPESQVEKSPPSLNSNDAKEEQLVTAMEDTLEIDSTEALADEEKSETSDSSRSQDARSNGMNEEAKQKDRAPLRVKTSFDTDDLAPVVSSSADDSHSVEKKEKYTSPAIRARKLILPTSITISTRKTAGGFISPTKIPLELPSMDIPSLEYSKSFDGKFSLLNPPPLTITDGKNNNAEPSDIPSPPTSPGLSRHKLATMFRRNRGVPYFHPTTLDPGKDSFEDDLTASTLGFCPFECVCGRGEACAGVSAAFYVLHDPRAGYSEAPSFWVDQVEEGGGFDTRNLREALGRYAMDVEDVSLEIGDKPYFIANHHFHPEVVMQSTERKNRAIPMFITKEQIEMHGMKLDDSDKVMDEEGNHTGDYFVVPSYGFEKSREDMKNVLWVRQTDEGSDLPCLQSPQAMSDDVKAFNKGIPELIGYIGSHDRIDFQPSRSVESVPNSPTRKTKSRSRVYATLTEYESSRKSAYTSRLESTCQEWRTAVATSLLTTSKEVDHAAMLAKKSALEKAMPIFKDRAIAVYVTTCMTHEVARFREEVNAQVAKVEQLGNSIISELACAEARLGSAWDGCSVIRSEPNSDFWIVEMCYRVSVAYQSSLWKKASKELSNLFGSVMETRYERCIHLQGLLLEFASQAKLLNGGPNHDKNQNGDASSCETDKEIQKLINEITNKGRQFSQLVFDMNCSRAMSPQSNFASIESPMTSKLVRVSKVMERKSSTGWQSILVVVTADSFFHLFDLPYETDFSSVTPEEAFLQLLPHVHLPTAENTRVRNSSSTDRHLLRYLTPKKTLFLPCCKTKTPPPPRCDFKLIEKRTTESGSDTSKKLWLQTKSHDETVELLKLLADKNKAEV